MSLHESGRYLFPGTGFAHEVGAGRPAAPWPTCRCDTSTTDDLYLAAFDAVVPAGAGPFQPEAGHPAGLRHPLHRPPGPPGADRAAYRRLAGRLHDLAHTVTEGRWLATGGGGYQWAAVVPRAWCSYLAEMVGAELPERLPGPYLEEVAERFGAILDPEMADEVVALRSEHRSRVEAELGRTIEVARSNLFPLQRLTV